MRSFDYESQKQRLSPQDDNRLQLKLKFSAWDDYELQRSLSNLHLTIAKKQRDPWLCPANTIGRAEARHLRRRERRIDRAKGLG